MLTDFSQHAHERSIDEWVNLTPREMMDCYSTVCQKYRQQIAEKPDLPDLEHQVKIMYDALVSNNIILFYFCQRYPRIFHICT